MTQYEMRSLQLQLQALRGMSLLITQSKLSDSAAKAEYDASVAVWVKQVADLHEQIIEAIRAASPKA